MLVPALLVASLPARMLATRRTANILRPLANESRTYLTSIDPTLPGWFTYCQAGAGHGPFTQTLGQATGLHLLQLQLSKKWCNLVMTFIQVVCDKLVQFGDVVTWGVIWDVVRSRTCLVRPL